MALGEKGRPDEAIPHFEKAVALDPANWTAHANLGRAYIAQHRSDRAIPHLERALRQAPDNPAVLNEAAWVLATCTDATLRNGTEAVTLAEHAVELTSGRDAAMLATLAAAYAETGRFDKAVELEKRAADLATQQGNAPLAATLRARLTQLEAKTPIRQP
jgi:tetratricopeptide (TPR) repeat protein